MAIVSIDQRMMSADSNEHRQLANDLESNGRHQETECAGGVGWSDFGQGKRVVCGQKTGVAIEPQLSSGNI